MKNALLAGAILLAIPMFAYADDGEWSGSGEAGLALTTGQFYTALADARVRQPCGGRQSR